ncbi:hypothetical protein BaRGS_00037862, partial [Batillaria attramentaria]
MGPTGVANWDASNWGRYWDASCWHRASGASNSDLGIWLRVGPSSRNESDWNRHIGTSPFE